MKMVIRAPFLLSILKMTEVGLVVYVGVIGGSGLYHLDNLTFVCVSGPTPEIASQSDF